MQRELYTALMKIFQSPLVSLASIKKLVLSSKKIADIPKMFPFGQFLLGLDC